MNAKDKKILVIDDEKDWIYFIRDILNKQGYRFVDEKYEVIRFSDLDGYDLAILDIVMPKYNGFQLKNYLKTHSPNTKVVLISQYEDFGLSLLSEASGADGWIEKKDLMDNDLDFIILIEELLKESLPRTRKDKAFDIPGNIVINDLNRHGIKTIEQVKTAECLVSLKKALSKHYAGNIADLFMDVDQLSLELSKETKNKAFIIKKLNEIEKAIENAENPCLGEIFIEIYKIISSKYELEKYKKDHKKTQKKTHNGFSNIEVNPHIYIKTGNHQEFSPKVNTNIDQLIEAFVEFKDLVLETAPKKKQELELIEDSLNNMKREDGKKNRQTIEKINQFIKEIGDEESELSKIIRGVGKGKELAEKMIKYFIKIAKYIPFDSAKDIFF